MRIPLDIEISLLGRYSNKLHAHVHQTYVQNVQSCMSHNSSKRQTTQMFSNSTMNTHIVVYSHQPHLTCNQTSESCKHYVEQKSLTQKNITRKLFI